ncbi:PAS domain-containing protein [Foetidibacter luteolus]|uniref:PAS domain-containing protein n=1 Tax=Foetidibacter luteolus TaxID=2608880 RepID=UPI00129B3D1F|nr:PAS domain-containing protein [Foetidibacter luteolus]
MSLLQKPEIRVTLIFLLTSSCWIIFSDMLLASISKTVGLDEQTGQTIKGLLYILVISLIIYFGVKKASQKLQNSFEEYKALFDSHPAPMWIFDTDLKFVRVNNAAVLKYGYTADEFLNMHIKDIRPKEEIEKLYRHIENVEPGYTESGIWTHKKKNGEIIKASVATHDVTYNNKKCLLVMAADITDVVQAREQLQASERSLSVIINNTKDLIWSFDTNMKLTAFNEPFAKAVKENIGIKATKGQDICADYESADTTREWIPYYKKALGGESFSTMHTGIAPNGQAYYMEATFNAITNEEGEVTGVVCFSRDVTDKQTQEEKIKQQNTALKEIAFTNSHIVRRPLSNLLGLTDMLSEDSVTDTLHRQVIENIKISALELDEVIREIARKAYAFKEQNG